MKNLGHFTNSKSTFCMLAKGLHIEGKCQRMITKSIDKQIPTS